MMPSLHLKIPPLVVAPLLVVLMWIISPSPPPLAAPVLGLVIAAIATAMAGAGIAIAGILAFRTASTTVNPLKPEKASSLVTSGIYTVTRNPMYLGLLFVLVGWAVFLFAPLAWVGPVVFVVYMDRFQIQPEEKVLESIFGASYREYTAKVRRWL